MILRVDTDSPVPPYEQIRSQVSTMVGTGVLPSGARLPSIRQLANDLGLAAGTVARAYRELEQTGVIATNGRRGTFVLRVRPSQPVEIASGHLARAARDFAIEASQLGVSKTDALDAARRAWAEVASG